MSEPFPSTAYKEFCTQPKVADRLREEWEPKFGDAVFFEGGDTPVLTGIYYVNFVFQGNLVLTYGIDATFDVPPSRVIPLFQPRQLIRMLEERGYDWSMGSGEGRYSIGLYLRTEMEYVGTWDGPSPATALLRAYLEVVGNG